MLEQWAGDEARRLGRAFTILPVPIVVDVAEQTPQPYPTGEPVVVFAGSPEYDEAIRFVFAAMERVWDDVPDCRLVVTGANPSDPASQWLRREAQRSGRDARLELAGYLDREDLLQLYGRARALLVPLFDDLRSRARFPTKIGEYLAAARPVVTSGVGEIPLLLRGRSGRGGAPAGDALAFGERVSGLLRDPEGAAAIVRAGRALAERRFHYALYADQLRDGFAAVARGGARNDETDAGVRPPAGAPRDAHVITLRPEATGGAGASLLVAGDLCIRQGTPLGDGGHPWEPLRTFIAGHDLSVVNLECPLTGNATTRTKFGPSLAGAPALAAVAREGGFARRRSPTTTSWTPARPA